MPGRQAHGRSLLSQQPKGKGKGKAAPPPRKPGSRAKALDAFAIAARDVPTKSGIRGTRARDLDFEPNQRKRGRDADGDDEDGDDDDGQDDDGEGPERHKRARRDGNDEVEYGSDSDGNEFMIGEVGKDDDSEIDSDEAFGDSDEEKFDGYTFRGSSSSKKPARRKARADDSDGEEDEEDEGEDDDGSSLGEDAIDLAAALDQVSDDDDEDDDDDDEGSSGDTESGSEEDDDNDSSSESSMLDDDQDPEKLSALRSLVAGFAGGADDDEPSRPSGKAKISLSDLTAAGIKEPSMKKALKQLQKDSKAADKPGSSQKLDVPLAKRQQDRLLRITAAETAHKTLDRWQETVKHNRRAEHLVFPLPDTLHDAGLEKTALAPLDKKSAGNELEQTILSIMEESGLGPSTAGGRKAGADGEQAKSMTKEERQALQAERRRERELRSREQARAARIKKIKSKAYRRVHRKERQRALDLDDEDGEPLDSEEEREAQHRARALERVGAKHRDSKWARSAKKAGIAAWDENARTGMVEMARRDQELRRRIEGRGKASGSGDESSDGDSEADSGSGDDDDDDDGARARRKLLQELEKVDAMDEEPRSELMKMKFMQRGEAVRKQANDDLVAQLRRELNSDEESDRDEEQDEPAEIGRRSYGGAAAAKTKKGKLHGASTDGARQTQPAAAVLEKTTNPFASASSAAGGAKSEAGAAGSWSRGKAATEARSKSDKRRKATADDAALDIDNTATATVKPSKAIGKTTTKTTTMTTTTTTKTAPSGADDSDSDADAQLHLPLGITDRALAERAFAGEDLVASSFAREKAAAASDDDDKVVDDALPGWGSWGGAGVRRRPGAGHHLTRVVAGVKKKKDRRDAKLERVIISEKRVRKNDKYLASQLPHVYENKEQYERSLRLPVGPEWTTKQTFQDATKPRILMKQGIIAPMAKPMT